jgi:hypothetical protein
LLDLFYNHITSIDDVHSMEWHIYLF